MKSPGGHGCKSPSFASSAICNSPAGHFLPLMLSGRGDMVNYGITELRNFGLTIHVRSSIMVSMNKLPLERRAQVIAALVEGNSIRSTVRMTGVAKNTITKLLVDVGHACETY